MGASFRKTEADVAKYRAINRAIARLKRMTRADMHLIKTSASAIEFSKIPMQRSTVDRLYHSRLILLSSLMIIGSGKSNFRANNFIGLRLIARIVPISSPSIPLTF